MFLKEALNEKLKRSESDYFNTNEMMKKQMAKSLDRKKGNKFQLLHFRIDKLKFLPNSNQADEILKSTKFNLNFAYDHKKFNDDEVNNSVREAKSFVKDLVDPDILEIRKKRWNMSSNPEQYEKPELQKTIFELRHCLKDSKIEKITEYRKIEPGTDTRNYGNLNWKLPPLLSKEEKKEIDIMKDHKAKNNSLQYWKIKEPLRIAETYEDLSDLNSKVRSNSTKFKNFYFKTYKNPLASAKELTNYIKLANKKTEQLREKIRKKVDYENPNSNPEKIDAIVKKRMFHTIRNEMDQMKGIKKSPNRKNKLDNDSTILANELETTPTEKNIELFANYNGVKTLNKKSQSPIKKKESYRKADNKFIHKEYRHPGTFNQFVFMEKKMDAIVAEKFKEKTVYAWSCCMNNNKHSLGCEKIVTNRMKWNYDSIP